MSQYRGILDLSNELLQLILDHIAADPDKAVGIDRREYLSQESFGPPPRPSPNQIKDIGEFRVTCRRFSKLAAPLLFSRFTTRFSQTGLARLDGFSEQRHLASHVKKFSYMVPCFYTEGHLSLRPLLTQVQQSVSNIDVERYLRKVQDQREIVRSQEDLRVLTKAISAFTNLQHVQILRVQDSTDEIIINFMRSHLDVINPSIELKWAPACLHSAKTIGAALLESRSSTFSRFSSPMLSPQSTVVLAEYLSPSFSTLAERLTCLELHFDDGQDLENRMQELSGIFKVVFTSAVNMEAVHIGFPSHRPISLPLETLFHNVQWKKLKAFGVQGWKLDSDEIIDLARRHRDRLKGLRLRDVLLKEGSLWKDVLEFLRSEMFRLDWVSLRRIGYAQKFDEYWENAGHEIPDDPPGGESDSDDNLYEAESDMYEVSPRESDFGSYTASDSDREDTDDEHGPAAHEMDFPPLDSPDTPNSAPWCNCKSRDFQQGVDDLNDDGVFVDNAKRKQWEKWVLGRCPEHGR